MIQCGAAQNFAEAFGSLYPSAMLRLLSSRWRESGFDSDLGDGLFGRQ